MSATILAPTALAEPELAEFLEREFGAAWFPEDHRCSIDTADATVFVDFDPGYPDRLPADELGAAAARVGFVPKAAVHIDGSKYHPGSAALAGRVLETLTRRVGGRELAAA